MQQSDGIGSHRFYGGTNKTENKYGITRAKMSTVINEGVNIHCKAVTTQVSTFLLVELGTDIEKSKGSIDNLLSLVKLPLQ